MFIFRRFAEISSYFRVCYILWIFSEQDTRYSVSVLKAEHSLYIFQRAGRKRQWFFVRGAARAFAGTEIQLMSKHGQQWAGGQSPPPFSKAHCLRSRRHALFRSFTIIMLPIDARRRPNRRSPCNDYSWTLAHVQKTSIDLLSHVFSFGAESEPHPVRWAKTEKSGFFQVTSLQY